MSDIFTMVVVKVDTSKKETHLWAAGDEDAAEVEMIWKYDSSISSISDNIGDTFRCRLDLIAKRGERVKHV